MGTQNRKLPALCEGWIFTTSAGDYLIFRDSFRRYRLVGGPRMTLHPVIFGNEVKAIEAAERMTDKSLGENYV